MQGENNITFTMHMNRDLHRKLKTYVASNGTTIKDYILGLIEENIAGDETEYLLSTEANRKALEAAIDDVKNNRNMTEMRFVNGILEPVKKA